MDPFADVSVHVRQAESVRLFAADRLGVATVFLEYPRCVSQCSWIIPGVEEGCCTGPAGEFPFGFGGQSIASRTGLCHLFRGDPVGPFELFARAQQIAEFNAVDPAHTFDRRLGTVTQFGVRPE